MDNTPTKGQGKRLREIIGILLRHNIIAGLSPQKLVLILEDLGPTFVKLGQLMAAQPTLPPAYSRALDQLRTQATPLPFSNIEAVLTEEYGLTWRDVFTELDPTPLGSASIAQVHLATLADASRVVLKIQRPGIYSQIANDILLLRRAAGLLQFTAVARMADLHMILDEMWAVSQQEMNFCTEADNIRMFTRNNADVRYIGCPVVYDLLSTERVLVMEYIDGIPICDCERLSAQGYDRTELGANLANNYLRQVIEDGFFHGDPHCGNILVRDEKIIWIDLGMMGRLGSRDREQIANAVAAVAADDMTQLTAAIIAIGVCPPDIDRAALERDLTGIVGQYGGMNFADMQITSLFEALFSTASAHGIRVPRGVAMLGRSLATLQGTLRALSPDLNLIELLAAYMSSRFLADFNLKKEASSLFHWTMRSVKSFASIPNALTGALNRFNNGGASLETRLSMPVELRSQVSRLLNRLIIAILCAAFFVGSALLCAAPLPTFLFDMPFAAVCGFLLSAFLGVWLLVSGLRRR